jgi:hypothetical protein
LSDDHLLNKASRIVSNAAIIANGDLDLAAGDAVAVLRHVEFQRRLQLTPNGIEASAGQRHADADFQRSMGKRGAAKQSARRRRGDAFKYCPTQHRSPPLCRQCLLTLLRAKQINPPLRIKKSGLLGRLRSSQ